MADSSGLFLGSSYNLNLSSHLCAAPRFTSTYFSSCLLSILWHLSQLHPSSPQHFLFPKILPTHQPISFFINTESSTSSQCTEGLVHSSSSCSSPCCGLTPDQKLLRETGFAVAHTVKGITGSLPGQEGMVAGT